MSVKIVNGTPLWYYSDDTGDWTPPFRYEHETATPLDEFGRPIVDITVTTHTNACPHCGK